MTRDQKLIPYGRKGHFAIFRAGRRLIVAVNYSGGQSQCYLPLPFADLPGRRWHLNDRLGKASYDRDGTELTSPGLYLDIPAWAYHVFELLPTT